MQISVGLKDAVIVLVLSIFLIEISGTHALAGRNQWRHNEKSRYQGLSPAQTKFLKRVQLKWESEKTAVERIAFPDQRIEEPLMERPAQEQIPRDQEELSDEEFMKSCCAQVALVVTSLFVIAVQMDRLPYVIDLCKDACR